MSAMRSISAVSVVVIAALALASCSRDPAVVKKRYLESGDKYFERARFKEAIIQYRNALKVDPRYGQAHYKLALAYMQVQPKANLGGAIKEFLRSRDLLKDQPEYWDATVKMSEIYLGPASSRNKTALDLVEKYCKELLERDANSFDGLRLSL